MTQPAPTDRRGTIRGAVRVVLLAALSCGCLPGMPASAQSLPPPPPGSPIDRMRPVQPVPVAKPRPAPAAQAPRAVPNADALVRIESVTFKGSTVYETGQLLASIGDLTGKAVTKEQIEEARVAILNLYRQDDYVFTAVTPAASETKPGELVFVITEGYVAEVKLSKDVGPGGTRVLGLLNNLTDPKNRPLRVSTLERWVLLASDVPGLGAHVTLLPSTEQPGALTLLAEVDHKWYNASISADNRAYQYSGPTQGLASVDLNSLTSLGERTNLTFFHSFDQTQLFGQGSTEFFAGSSGLKVKFYGGAGDSRPGGVLAATGYYGFTKIFGGQISYPVFRQREFTLNLFGMVDALEGQVLNGGNRTFDSLRVVRAGPDIVWSDIWGASLIQSVFGEQAGNSWSGANSFTFRMSKGLPALGASRDNVAGVGNVGAVYDFTKATFDFSRTQALYVWDDRTLSVRGEVAGQYSFHNLLPGAEKYLLGGAHFGRGYYAGEVTGDSGVTGTAELILATPVKAENEVWPWFQPKAEIYTFYDSGQSFEVRAADATHSLQSVGLGIRFFPTGTPAWEIDLEGVKRLQLYPQGRDVSALKGEAFYWQLATRF